MSAIFVDGEGNKKSMMAATFSPHPSHLTRAGSCPRAFLFFFQFSLIRNFAVRIGSRLTGVRFSFAFWFSFYVAVDLSSMGEGGRAITLLVNSFYIVFDFMTSLLLFKFMFKRVNCVEWMSKWHLPFNYWKCSFRKQVKLMCHFHEAANNICFFRNLFRLPDFDVFVLEWWCRGIRLHFSSGFSVFNQSVCRAVCFPFFKFISHLLGESRACPSATHWNCTFLKERQIPLFMKTASNKKWWLQHPCPIASSHRRCQNNFELSGQCLVHFFFRFLWRFVTFTLSFYLCLSFSSR